MLAVIIPLEQQAGETLPGHCQVDEAKEVIIVKLQQAGETLPDHCQADGAQEVIVVKLELAANIHKQARYNLHYNA